MRRQHRGFSNRISAISSRCGVGNIPDLANSARTSARSINASLVVHPIVWTEYHDEDRQSVMHFGITAQIAQL